ncbi:MAG: MarR family transcriptional regulator [Muribaculaceae bacterium]|nr:MarR family transcriptional regulator [Muribaculaceae bacterium]
MTSRRANIAVVGCTNIDIVAAPYGRYMPGEDLPGSVAISFGGVGRNIAHNLVLMGCEVTLVTVFGDDNLASRIKQDCARIGIDTSHCAVVRDAASSMFIAINDENGELMSAIAAMDIADRITPDFIRPRMALLNTFDVVVIEAGIPTETIAYILDNCTVPVFADTVSMVKSSKIYNALDGTRHIHTLKMNRSEALQLTGSDTLDFDATAALLHAKGVERVFITLGAQGCYCHDRNGGLYMPCEKARVVSVTGAGDAFLSGALLAFCKGLDTEKTIKCALRAAAMTVASAEAVNPNMTEKYVLNE